MFSGRNCRRPDPIPAFYRLSEYFEQDFLCSILPAYKLTRTAFLANPVTSTRNVKLAAETPRIPRKSKLYRPLIVLSRFIDTLVVEEQFRGQLRDSQPSGLETRCCPNRKALKRIEPAH